MKTILIPKRLLLLLFALAPMLAQATTYSYKSGGLIFSLNNANYTAKVTKYTSEKYSGCITIPSTVVFDYDDHTYTVKGIDESAFYQCDITSVVIPNTVTSIGAWAFQNCEDLTSIDIPNSVTSIGNGAFYNCSSLRAITLPNSLTSIGIQLFQGCQFMSITIPNSVTSIGDRAFSHCSSLISVTIPDGVTSIGEYAFSSCSSLVSVTIGKSLTSIESGTFYNCPKIQELIYAEGCTTAINARTESATQVTIPESVMRIENYAFYGYAALTSVTIPSRVTSIGLSAFKNCLNLTSVTIPNSVKSTVSGAFENCPIDEVNVNITSFEVNSKLRSILPSSANWEYYFNGTAVKEIPEGTTVIGDYALYNYKDLPSIYIPNSVTSIGSNAFRNCSSLTSVTIPNSVTSIGSDAFDGCM